LPASQKESFGFSSIIMQLNGDEILLLESTLEYKKSGIPSASR
jgi:hypothetical protein